MRQQAYFIKPVNHLSYRNQSNKQSFQQQGEESKSRSQNKLSNMKKPTPIITQPITSPQLKRINNQLRILKSNKVELPTLQSPPNQLPICDQSLSKFKSFENLNFQMRQPTPRRFKSDEQNISDIQQQPNKIIRSSQHISNIRFRNESGKLRNRSNHTPFTKIKTEPNEIIPSPKQVRKQFDDSRELLYQLQRGNSKEKYQALKTEPDDPYRLGQNLSKNDLRYSIKNQEDCQQCGQYYVDIPGDDEFSEFIKEEDPHFKNTQKRSAQNVISQETKEKILDLLFLSTGELKRKFNEQSRIQQSKITNRINQNKPVIPKGKFPNDFFNILHTNDSQLI